MHIEELADYYRNLGYQEAEALKKAISDMGSAEEIGKKLNNQHKPQTEWGTVLLSGLITFAGIFLMYISSNFENQSVSFFNHIIHVVIGVFVLLGVYFSDYTMLKKHPGILFFSAVFFLIICRISGTDAAGVKSYIKLGGIGIYVNAVVGVLFCCSFCGFIEKYRDEGVFGIFKIILLGAVSFVPFIIQPSIATALMLFTAYAAVLLTAVYKNHFEGNSKLQMISLVSLGGFTVIFSFFALMLNSPQRVQRIFMFLNNGASDPQGGGWIYVMADKVLKSSKLIGKALPLPEGEISWVLPGITTDFALLNFINNFGIIAGAFLILAVFIFILRMFFITSKIKNSFGFYLSLISCTMLSIQFLINILMNLGLCPHIEVTLPFISYGGSSYVTNMVYVGFVLSVWRKNNILKKSQRNIKSKTKLITFADNKLIIDFNVKK